MNSPRSVSPGVLSHSLPCTPTHLRCRYNNASQISPQNPSVAFWGVSRSEEHTSELQSRGRLVCRHLLEKKRENRRRRNGNKTTNLTRKEAKRGKVMRHTLGASLNTRHNLSSSKAPKSRQLTLSTTNVPK